MYVRRADASLEVAMAAPPPGSRRQCRAGQSGREPSTLSWHLEDGGNALHASAYNLHHPDMAQDFLRPDLLIETITASETPPDVARWPGNHQVAALPRQAIRRDGGG